MPRSFLWQPILLAASALLAIALAIGGWTLGRRRSHQHSGPKPAPPAPIEAQATPNAIAIPDASGAILLEPSTATLRGAIARSLVADEDAIIGWSSAQDTATWQFRTNKLGFCMAELTYGTTDSGADAELELRLDDRKRLCSLRASGGLERFITDEYPVAVSSSGLHQLTIQSHSDIPGPWLVLRSIRLIPTKADK